MKGSRMKHHYFQVTLFCCSVCQSSSCSHHSGFQEVSQTSSWLVGPPCSWPVLVLVLKPHWGSALVGTLCRVSFPRSSYSGVKKQQTSAKL